MTTSDLRLDLVDISYRIPVRGSTPSDGQTIMSLESHWSEMFAVLMIQSHERLLKSLPVLVCATY